MHALLTERCAATLAEREADAAAFARRVETRVETQANEWRTRTRRVGAFLERVAALVETHRFLATRASEANVEASAARRARHVRRDESNEAAVREAREAIARAADETALDEATARATRALDRVEGETHDFFRDATDLVDANPTEVAKHFDEYQPRLCRALRLVFVPPPPTPPEGTDEGDDAEADERKADERKADEREADEREADEREAEPDPEPEVEPEPASDEHLDEDSTPPTPEEERPPVDPREVAARASWSEEDALEPMSLEATEEEDDGKPVERIRIVTSRGTMFAVFERLYDAVVFPPPPPPELDEMGTPSRRI